MKNTNPSNARRWSIRTDDMPLHAQEGRLLQALPDNLGSGHSNIVQLDPDLNLIDTLYTPSRDLSILSEMDNQEPRLVVTLGLKGHSRFLGQQGDEIVFSEGYTTITSFNSSLGERHYEADKPVRQLRFSITEKWLDRYFGGGIFSSLFKKNGIQTISQRPISPNGLISAQRLLAGHSAKELMQVFRHGQALAILASELSHICETGYEEGARISQKDMAIAKSARDILSHEFRTPPSVEELARRVGTNQFKLKSLFHQVFDNTPYGLLLEIRMNKAYQLLESTRQVSVVADLVGYGHASNFSAAFVKFFGFSPKTVSKKS